MLMLWTSRAYSQVSLWHIRRNCKRTRCVIHNQIYTDHLVHEQAEVCEYDPSPCLQLVTLEQGSVAAYASLN